ncbi:gamma-glutamyl-gamma-aminobutyrate hydrolase family protein [Ktedonosporobacter rubrisoli]|uniref:Gamma-glutamyl-gamma-aminobutyrate hydrolase family protein n=1 Tax=Ktedonosporobacter rubrisoli TaxID=2509675 RepID=A0A4P6JYD4_KTERU|nr:gamma-glutamyl-gamma-aminobutyrate hydrolase family protein [Ktedonosporobacter rubrisoli]QBD80450.1 gamma-glutamyl-gamma-aminobutyrate hydrolase family protein [Ktedonosporobacter rubrisoli]
MRPLVGIPCRAGVSTDPETPDRPIYFNNRAYIHAVEHAGGVPILIPLLDDLSGLEALRTRLDGLLLSGGIDVDPKYYHENPHHKLGATDCQLDELELSLARWAFEQNVPTLGICRGMQVINVALGGTLYQDLQEEYPESLRHANWDRPRNTIIHQLRVERGSHMEELLGALEVPANSLHHQAIKEAGKGVRITGYAEDGVIELLEVPEHRFMVAAQCHPEELYKEHQPWARYFQAFIEACSVKSVRQFVAKEPVLVAEAS